MKLQMLLLAAAVLSSTNAQAQAVPPSQPLNYNLSFTSMQTGAFANLYVTLPSAGAAATSASGTFGTLSVTGLSTFDGADNKLSLNAPYVTFAGFSFGTSDGNIYNLFEVSGTRYLENVRDCPQGNCYLGGNQPYDTVSNINVAQVAAAPEPSTWTLMILGFGAVGGVLRRKRARSWRLAVV